MLGLDLAAVRQLDVPARLDRAGYQAAAEQAGDEVFGELGSSPLPLASAVVDTGSLSSPWVRTSLSEATA